MKRYLPAIYCDHPEYHFELRTAARIARVSEEFIERCEHEELVTCRVMLHGKKGLCTADVGKLKIIRHLHEDMGLDLDAVDFVLRYREQMAMMERRMQEIEQRLRNKEKTYQDQIQALRWKLSQLTEGD
jgi:hypothetical protein